MRASVPSWQGRVAFVGQSTYFEACALPDGAAPGIQSTFVEFRKDGDAQRMLAEVTAFRPDVVVVFRPEVIPAGLFAELPARTLGFLTEPLPRERQGGAVRHEDLGRRLWELEQVDPTGFDRVVAFDPHIAQTASQVLPVWRSLPLPVSDRFYRDPASLQPRTRRQVLFVGRSTEHREWLLTPAKHGHDVLHLAFGVDAAMLEELMGQHDVALNLHNQSYLSFENRVCLHLAAGQLVLTEPLHPLHGLEPGIDVVTFTTPNQLTELLSVLHDAPATFHGVRLRGRRKAELYRASRVYPRLLADLDADLRAFGSPRTRIGATA